MAVHAVRLHQRHRRRDRAQQLVGDRRRLDRRGRWDGGGRRIPVAGALEQAREPRMGRDDVAATAFEELAPLRRDRVRVLEVVLEKVAREPRVQPIDVGHYCCCSNRATRAGCS